MNLINWKKAGPKAFKIENDVHIWLISFSNFTNPDNYHTVMSKVEIARAAKFYHAIDRKRFIISRALVKIILSKILNTPAKDIQFYFNAHGKPGLKSPDVPIYFNISHSGDLGMIAITDISEIGVDVERYRQNMLAEKIVKRFFSNREIAEYMSLPNEQKEEGFFNCWTRKEAFIKAMGLGLTMSLKDFDVNLTPQKEAHIKAIRNIAENASGWTLKNIPLNNYYSAALAIKSLDIVTHYWEAEDKFLPAN